MELTDFSYDFLIRNFPVEFEQWYNEFLIYDERLAQQDFDADTLNAINRVVTNIRTAASTFDRTDNSDLKTFFTKLDKIINTNNWITNFGSTTLVLNDGSELELYSLTNSILSNENLTGSGLQGIFRSADLNKHFPHLFAAIKNIQEEDSYPVYYKYWQDMYKYIKNTATCSYDELTVFYREFSNGNRNKYKAFGVALNLFNVEYLKYCIGANKGYATIEKVKKLTREWHTKKEEFINQIHTPMQKMDFINLDQWRQLNEKLFRSYIKCYADLENGTETVPAESMLNALTQERILLTVTARVYGSYYTIGRELGIYYQDADDKFILGEIASKYSQGEITYSDYLKYYILNSEFMIDGKVVHPFEEILNVISISPATLNDLAAKCVNSIPATKRSDQATGKLHVFIKRAIDANLIKQDNDLYSLSKDPALTLRAISKSGLSVADFEAKFVGSGKSKQENIVKDMINRAIPPEILDGLGTLMPEPATPASWPPMPPLNQILFGPPGTGKTYSTVEMALEILNESSTKTDETKKMEENREIFRSLLNKKIFFVTMHPSYSYEDFVQGLKPYSENGNLLFEPKDGIFKNASQAALFNYKAQKNKVAKEGKVEFDLVFEFAFRQLIEDNEPVIVDRESNPFKITHISDKTLKFETSTGGTGPTYNLSRITIRKIYEKGVNEIILSGNKGYFDSLLVFLNKKSAELRSKIQSTEFDNNNFVLILDEINRANISKVFGELITLLEDDKRLGSENELIVTLPSGETFGVPPNLYIIGTMNTADKSIALVDIALRRRFQFIPVYPKPEIVDKFCKSADKDDKRAFMISLNAKLRIDKGVDFQIGHAYFLKNNMLADVINQNILPLLTEYYRNDLEKVKKVMLDLGYPVDEEYYTNTGLLKYVTP